MNDLDFYKKALRIQSVALSYIAQVPAYIDYLSAERARTEILKTFQWLREKNEHNDLFSMDNLTKERALCLGFSYWDKKKEPDFLLFPLWYAILFLPYGTKVKNIRGFEEEFTCDTDLDNRSGCVGFGMFFKNEEQ